MTNENQTPLAKTADANRLPSSALLGSVARPSTYEQLIAHLNAGQTCEVPDYMLRFFKGWTVAHSPRFGFVFLLPNK